MASAGVVDIATVPRFQVDLDAPAETRWAHIVEVYAQQLRSVEAQLEAELKAVAPVAGPVVVSFTESIMSAANKLNVVYYADELKGIAKVAGIPVGRLVSLQLMYEACAQCTSIVTPTSPLVLPPTNGSDVEVDPAAPRMAHIRTMDWEMPCLKPLTIEVEFMKGGRPIYIASTWVGYVGVLTGLALRPENPIDQFSISVNFRAAGSGTFWTNLKRAIGSAWPVGFLVRESLESATGYDQAACWLRVSDLIAPTYISICGVKDGTLITRDRKKEEHPWDVSTSGPFVQANMDHFAPEEEEEFFYSRQRSRIGHRGVQKLLDRAGKGGDPIRADDLWAIMSIDLIHNDATVYGTFMCPTRGILETRIPRANGFTPSDSTRGQLKRLTNFQTCENCHQRFDPALNAPKQCVHAGKWHETYDDCSYVKCAFGLGPSGVGKKHWSCCFSTDKDAMCSKSGPHVAATGAKRNRL